MKTVRKQLDTWTVSKAIEHDHNYCSEDSFRDKSTQTDFDLPLQLHNLQHEMHELRRENEKLNAKLKDKESLKRELFMENVLKNDDSVKFYTGLPTLSCLLTLFNLIKP